MIFNIGEDNINKTPKEFHSALKDLVSAAHANGDICIYVFDANIGPFKIPDEFDNIEDMDFVRMSFDVCNRRDLNFNLLPAKRMEELKAISDHVKAHPNFNFDGQVSFCGLCSIGGSKVYMPHTELPNT